jgi:hypothetical protein
MLRITSLRACLAVLGGFCTLSAAQDTRPPAAEKLFERIVSNDQLARQRGGADTRVLNFMDLDAALHSNSARANVSGNNAVGGSAFSNMSGLATVIQNSGNNVIIQNATILNLDLR